MTKEKKDQKLFTGGQHTTTPDKKRTPAKRNPIPTPYLVTGREALNHGLLTAQRMTGTLVQPLPVDISRKAAARMYNDNLPSEDTDGES